MNDTCNGEIVGEEFEQNCFILFIRGLVLYHKESVFSFSSLVIIDFPQFEILLSESFA